MKAVMEFGPKTSVRPQPTWQALLEHAAIEVFETANAPVESVTTPPGEPIGDQTAIVGMAGALCGMTTIRCGRRTAEKLSLSMLGGGPGNITNAMDALGELCNMIAGNFKSKINSLVDRCMLSVPTVISGENYVMQLSRPTESFVVCLTYEGAPIWVSLIVHL